MAKDDANHGSGGFGRLKPNVGKQDNIRVDQLVQVCKLRPDKWVTVRFTPQFVLPVVNVWFKVMSKAGKEANFAKICTNFDPRTDDFTDETCPYTEAGGRPSKEYWANAIIRDVQENEPKKKGNMTKEEKKTGFKEKDSDAWTPVEVIRLVSSLALKIMKLAQLNEVKNKAGEKVAYDLSHPKYGCDVNIMYCPKEKNPGNMYQVQKGDRTPLTEEELAYLTYDLEALIAPLFGADAKERKAKLAEAKLEVKRINVLEPEDDDDDEDDDDEVMDKKKKKKGKEDKKSKKSKKDEDDDDDSDDDDEDDEPKTKKSSKKPAKKSSKDEDDDDDDEDEDDDDEPKSKKSSKKTAAKKGKSKKDEDEDDEDDDDLDDLDDDEDSDDEDDEDDEPKSKKGKKAPAKKGKSKKDEDDDDDDDEDDEDSDDEDDDDSDDDDDDSEDDDDEDSDDDSDDEDDDDEDEDDEPKSKKGKKAAPAKKPAAKAKSKTKKEVAAPAKKKKKKAAF